MNVLWIYKSQKFHLQLFIESPCVKGGSDDTYSKYAVKAFSAAFQSLNGLCSNGGLTCHLKALS